MNKALSVALLLSLSSGAFAYTKGKTYKITVLHTNDHHGHFFVNKDGEYGMAARATLIEQVRREVEKDGGLVLLVDAGDVNTGTAQSDVQDAEPDFKAMAKLGYDVMAIGNHEFDNSLKTIFKQRKWAGFPFVSSNIYYKNSSRRVFPSHIEKEFQDLKISILGLTTEDTPVKSNPKHSENLIFRPAVEEAKKVVPRLRKNSDVLIAVTHMGHYENNERDNKEAPGDVALAQAVKGIDLIVGGHSATKLEVADFQNGTIIVQAKDWGKYLGRVDLEFLDGKVNLKNYKLIPVNLKGTEKVEQNPEMAEFLRPFKEKGDASFSAVVGSLDVDMIGDASVIRNQEMPLGNFVTTAYREKFKTDIGYSNSGGIRSTLPGGTLTLESIFAVHPFGNEVGTATLTGAELRKFLEYVLGKYIPGSSLGGYPQMSGVEVSFNRSSGKVVKLKVNGIEVSDEVVYSIAISKFLAFEGGDSYPKFPTFKSYGIIDFDILKEYVEKKKVIKASDYAVKNYITYE